MSAADSSDAETPEYARRADEAEVTVDDGITVFARTLSGDGPAATLLLHGWGGHADQWPTPLIARLLARGDVIAIDHRGSGRSGKPDDVAAYSMPRFAKDACTVLDALGRSSVDVLGVSMGGMVAQALVARHPARVRSAVLVATHAGASGERQFDQRFLDVVQSAPSHPDDAEGTSAFEQRLAEVIFSEPFRRADPDAVNEFLRQGRRFRTSSIALRGQFTAMFRFDELERVAESGIPILVVEAAMDEVIPPENSRCIADAVPGARRVVIEEAGHGVLFERPQRSADEILAFLDAAHFAEG